MATILLIFHVLFAVAIIALVLLQQGKGADAGASFGGGSNVFGAGGPAPLLVKATTALAILFFFANLALVYLAAHRGGSSLEEMLASETSTGLGVVETPAPKQVPPAPTLEGAESSEPVPKSVP